MSFSKFFADGSLDHTNSHQPGHRFADTDDKAALAAAQAYRERSKRMENAWRGGDGENHQDAEPKKLTLDEAEQAALAAYEARSARMRDGWKR